MEFSLASYHLLPDILNTLFPTHFFTPKIEGYIRPVWTRLHIWRISHWLDLMSCGYGIRRRGRKM
jgi:hypothetical protein